MAPWIWIIVGLVLIWAGATNKARTVIMAALGKGAAPNSTGGSGG